MSYNGGTTAINPTTYGSRSSGYESYGAVMGNQVGQGGQYTDSGASNRGVNFDDKWNRWFGVPPYSNFQHDNYADLGHENYTLPTAYIGRNLHIEKLLNVSIASTDDFYTRVLLPWQSYDGMRITWSKWSGFDHLMTQVPEEVPAPQIQTRFESGEAYQQRYGLAFKMEHGFQKTQMGQQAYAMNLAIITQAVLRTVYARVMQVLVQQRNFLAVLANQTYATDMARAREVSKGSTLTFGALQKNTFGFDNALASVIKLFENRRLQAPDAVVIPHGSFGVLKMCKPESRTYAICGELAQRLDMNATRDFVSNVYNNQFQIFEHRPMNISQDSNEINMLTRQRDVGNVFRIFRDGTSYSGTAAQGCETAIKIVDHDKQRWRTISLVEALENSGAFKDGVISEEFNNKVKWFVRDRIEPASGRSAARKRTITASQTGKEEEIIWRFGDLNSDYLTKIIREVKRSIDGCYKQNSFKAVDVQNVLYPSTAATTTSYSSGDPTNAPIGVSVDPISGASVEDVRDAIVSAIVGSSTDIGSDSDVVSEAQKLASKTTENMPPSLRGAIVETISGSGDAIFSRSIKKVSQINKNSSTSKAPELKQALLKEMQSDFRKNWTQLSRDSREALRANEEAVAASFASAPIGAPLNTSQAAGLDATNDYASYPLMKDSQYSWWFEVPVTLHSIRVLDQLGIMTPFGAYVFRPFQSFEMGSMIVMKAGTDTGMTVVGNSDFQLGDSVTNKTHLGHFTFYFESIVHEPNHIMIVRDAMFMKYNGGAGGRFYKWENGQMDHDSSLFAVIALHCESYEEYMHDPMDITGRFHSNSQLAALQHGDEKTYLASDFYRGQFSMAATGIDQNQFDVDQTTRDSNDAAFYVDNSINSVVYQGLQMNRGANGEFNQPITNTGHLGDSETVDSSLTWSGHMSFKTSVGYHQNQNTVGLVSKSS